MPTFYFKFMINESACSIPILTAFTEDLISLQIYIYIPEKKTLVKSYSFLQNIATVNLKLQQLNQFILKNKKELKHKMLQIDFEYTKRNEKSDFKQHKYDYFFCSEEKPEEDFYRKNEDTIGIEQQKNQLVFALSDGAGGSGLLSADWSKTLVHHCLKQVPTAINLDHWLGEFAFDFFEKAKDQIQDPFKKTKLVKEGSFATLVTGQLNLQTQQVSAISYGDSIFFHFDQNWQLQGFMPEYHLMHFLENPYLINWKLNINPAEIKTYQATIKIGDKIMIASDALSLLILTLYEFEQPQSEQIEQILNSEIKNKLTQTIFKLNQKEYTLKQMLAAFKANFSQEIMQLYQEGCVMRDDYSIIVIERKA